MPEQRDEVVQLELLTMGKTGELKQLWQVAAVTNIRINLVRWRCMSAGTTIPPSPRPAHQSLCRRHPSRPDQALGTHCISL